MNENYIFWRRETEKTRKWAASQIAKRYFCNQIKIKRVMSKEISTDLKFLESCARFSFNFAFEGDSWFETQEKKTCFSMFYWKKYHWSMGVVRRWCQWRRTSFSQWIKSFFLISNVILFPTVMTSEEALRKMLKEPWMSVDITCSWPLKSPHLPNKKHILKSNNINTKTIHNSHESISPFFLF